MANIENLANLFDPNRKTDDITLKENAAKLLRTSPAALAEFEKAYQMHALDDPGPNTSGGLFDVSAKQVNAMRPDIPMAPDETLTGRIVNELLSQTEYMHWNGSELSFGSFLGLDTTPVTLEDIMAIPEPVRPQLSGSYVKKHIGEPSYLSVLDNFTRYANAKDPEAARIYYGMFRQGLDILDLDHIMYNIISTCRNAMGYWLPALCEAVAKQDFFKVPETRVVNVPLPLLQLTRLDYTDLTPGTMKVLDDYCIKAFKLDESKEYFIKTGVFSSKFDFRNAHVHGAKEVRELGEYLLFIHNQAVNMASPLHGSMYGAATTTNWVVRKFVPDPENNPTIYKGLPLRTEYRFFVRLEDAATSILGASPYWRPDVMRQRFGHAPDANSPHQKHDYVTYAMAEPELMRRYNENIGRVMKHIENILPDMRNAGLTGDWSIDVMQSGDEFYIIDMALARNSALNDVCGGIQFDAQPEIVLPRLSDCDRNMLAAHRENSTGSDTM